MNKKFKPLGWFGHPHGKLVEIVGNKKSMNFFLPGPWATYSKVWQIIRPISNTRRIVTREQEI